MPGKSLATQELEALAADRGQDAPAQYRPAHALRATDACMLGATNEELAMLLAVSVSTIERWLVERPAFRVAVRKGREGADERVARALYTRAVGTKVRKEKAFNVEGKLQTIEITEGLPPDVNAASLWLSNRQRGKWRAANAGADLSAGFDLNAFAAAIAQATVKAQAQPGDDAKPVDLLDEVAAKPEG